LEGDEQLLAFARGRLAGGWRGKLTVGPEAFFAPYVNIGLTERRFVLQHFHPENGRPSEILPHFFPLADIAGLTFSDVETFGAAPSCRLVLRLHNDQHFRLRLEGAANFENARQMVEVFQSLTVARHRDAPRPTESLCAHCGHILDQPSKFCPYCGQRRTDMPVEPPAPAPAAETAPPEESPTTERFAPPAAPDFGATPSEPPGFVAPPLPEETSPDTARYEQPASEMLSEALAEAHEEAAPPEETKPESPAGEFETPLSAPEPAKDEDQTHDSHPS
jgi:hypothetical protein